MNDSGIIRNVLHTDAPIGDTRNHPATPPTASLILSDMVVDMDFVRRCVRAGYYAGRADKSGTRTSEWVDEMVEKVINNVLDKSLGGHKVAGVLPEVPLGAA